MSKLLVYGETPFIPTGAAQVMEHLLPVFHERFDEIHLIAINQVFPVENLVPGLSITCAPQEDMIATDEARAAIAACDYDCLFLTTDINRITDLRPEIQQAKQAGIPVIMYAAMDTHIWARNFWEILTLADVPIVFSEWCKRHALRLLPEIEDRLQVIYHGTEPDVFYPLSSEERAAARRDIFGLDDDTFLVINVNRNQPRKDLARSMAAFHLFHLEHPKSLLYLHAKQQDLAGNLPTQAAFLGLTFQGPETEIVFAPESLTEWGGASRAELNRIYNAADVCISTSTGEGWGLTTTEAMAAGVPFIGPNHTTFPEILGRQTEDCHDYTVGERGLLVEAGGPNLWTLFYGHSETARALSSTVGMHEALASVLYNRKAAKERAERARAWTLEHTWTSVQDQWRGIFASLKEKVLA